jgi:hypothetical protein
MNAIKYIEYKYPFPFDIWYAARIGWLDGVKMYVETISCPVDVKVIHFQLSNVSMELY